MSVITDYASDERLRLRRTRQRHAHHIKIGPPFLIVFAAILFGPVGSLRFWQDWGFMVLLFVPGIFPFLYFCKHDPKLIEQRQTNEKIREQKRLVSLLKVIMVVAFFLPALRSSLLRPDD
jgi:hypothetical protein